MLSSVVSSFGESDCFSEVSFSDFSSDKSCFSERLPPLESEITSSVFEESSDETDSSVFSSFTATSAVFSDLSLSNSSNTAWGFDDEAERFWGSSTVFVVDSFSMISASSAESFETSFSGSTSGSTVSQTFSVLSVISL